MTKLGSYHPNDLNNSDQAFRL